jgi:predicted alpha/beta superfamily hydrolase
MKYFLCFAFLLLSFFVSNAQSHIHTIDSAFFIPQLNSSAPIWIYLPDGYEKGKKHYPVLYVQEGQIFFDDRTTASGEWAVDKCLDSLIAAGKQACIVVGIDNLTEKMNEQNPFVFSDSGAINRYLYFITQTLKPFIDKHYRTLTSKENTIIAGSSMGALISYYAMMKQPQVFGKAGVFLPVLWVVPQIKSFTDSLASKINGKFFFYIGGQERYGTGSGIAGRKICSANLFSYR